MLCLDKVQLKRITSKSPKNGSQLPVHLDLRSLNFRNGLVYPHLYASSQIEDNHNRDNICMDLTLFILFLTFFILHLYRIWAATVLQKDR